MAFGVFMVLLLAPNPWADRLGSVYGYYALGLLGLFLGTLVALLTWNLRRLARGPAERVSPCQMVQNCASAATGGDFLSRPFFSYSSVSASPF